MADITTFFRKADFSIETDLKERLAQKLFRQNPSEKIIPFRKITEEDAELVSAARGILQDDPFKENR